MTLMRRRGSADSLYHSDKAVMKTHIESINDLRQLVQSVGFNISGIDDRDEFKQVATQEGPVVNWFSSTGRLSFQGEPKMSARFEGLIMKELQSRGEVPLTF